MGLPVDSMLSVQDVADKLSISNIMVYRLIADGRLGAIRIGRSYRISEEQYTQYIRNSSTLPIEDYQCDACKTYQMIVDKLNAQIAELQQPATVS